MVQQWSLEKIQSEVSAFVDFQWDEQGVWSILFNRDFVKNAFDGEVIQALHRILDGAEKFLPRVLILTHDLKNPVSVFCAGADLKWMQSSLQLTKEENQLECEALSRLFYRLSQLPVVLIAAIQGAAFGGAVGLLSVCDYVIAQKETWLSLAEVRVGLVPACIAPYVLRKIGLYPTLDLFLSARRISAIEAQQVGLINQVEVEVSRALEVYVEQVLKGSMQAQRAAKQLVLKLAQPLDAKIIQETASVLAQMRVSHQGQEGLQAFLQKRPAVFDSWQLSQGLEQGEVVHRCNL